MNAERHLQEVIGKARLTPLSDLAERIVHPSPAVRRNADHEAGKRLRLLRRSDPPVARKTETILRELKRCRRPTMHPVLRGLIALSMAGAVYALTNQVSSQLKTNWDTFIPPFTDQDVLIWGLTVLTLLWTLLRTSRA